MSLTVPASTRPGRALAFANLGHFLNHVIMLVYPTVALTLAELWQMPYGELFRLFFLGSLLYGVAALPAGWLGDRWSTWWMLAIYLLGTGFATVLTGFAQTPAQVMAGLALIGLFASIYHPVGTNFVVQHAVNRARELGYNGAWGTFGLAAASFIAAGLTQLWGWRAAFFVPGAACLALGIAFMLLTDRGSEAATARAEAYHVPLRAGAVWRALGILVVTTLAVGLIAQAYTTGLPKVFDGSLQGFVSLFSLEREGGRTLSAGLVTAVILCGVAGQLVGGQLAARFSPKAVYVGMFAALVPLALIAAHVAGIALVVAGAAMMLVMTACLPAENWLVARFCPDGWLARAYSAKFVLALGGGSFALLAVGEIFDRTTGFLWFYGFLAALALVIVVAGAFLPAARGASGAAAPVPGPAE